MWIFYIGFFQNLGFAHPLHPPLTHMPIGLVIGAFIFLLSAILVSRQNRLSITAHHCLVMAFIFIFPAVFFGFTDWLHFYAGVWLFEIKVKIGLSIALLFFLVISFLIEIKKLGGFMSKTTGYLLCVICVIGLGYLGGSLVYADKASEIQGNIKKGKELYVLNCGTCHPKGGNTIMPSVPVINSSRLKTLNEFTNYIRDPKKLDGSPSTMPPISERKLSDQQANNIYQYIMNSLAKPEH